MIKSIGNTEEIIGEIAVIGMAGRFPGARNIDEFWENLKRGNETIRHFSNEELEPFEFDFNSIKDNPNYIKARGFLEDIDRFDASFFGFSPGEASMLDPQHRIWLETVWEALENAGYFGGDTDTSTGVFAGSFYNNYLIHNLLKNRSDIEEFVRLRSAVYYSNIINNDSSYLPARTSFKLNLKGPSINVQTACSTSLVAISMACQSLLNYESDICIVGGVCIAVPQESGYLYQEGAIFSKDGHCRPFDADANGTVLGNGVGAVILKRLQEAIDDRDNILAVIKGTAVNNDGSMKVSFTAPSVDGQAEVIAAAQSFAGVNPESISYIEAHGTGTPMGDPIEIAALNKVFCARTDAKQFCGVGSVKGNIGHLDAAAGVAGFIKTVLALQHRQLPPTIHYKNPNPEIDFENSPFFVVDKLTDWKSKEFPLRAGVSSFGIGGTNAHVIVEQAPASITDTKSRSCQLLLLSAKTETALEKTTENIQSYLKKNPEKNIPDIAYTLITGRKSFNKRRFIVCEDDNFQALKVLKERNPNHYVTGSIGDIPEIVFMFPGQGSHYLKMGFNIYNNEPVFKEAVDRCCDLANQYLEKDLKNILWGNEDDSYKGFISENNAYAQLAIFTIDYSLTILWNSWGVFPDVLIGHSLGEWAAACIADVISLEDAIKIIFHRGRLMQSLSTNGGAISVRASRKEISQYINEDLSIAAVNSPTACVISGTEEQIDICTSKLKDNNILYKKLNLALAVHSSMIDPIIEPFRKIINEISLSEPKIPIMSTVTGDWIASNEITDSEYWARHMREAISFSNGITKLWGNKDYVLLEVGPSTMLSILARQHRIPQRKQIVISSLSDTSENNSEIRALLTALGKLWLLGIDIDWKNFYKDEKRYRLPLPAYPFERHRYWIDPPATKNQEEQHAGIDHVEKKTQHLDEDYNTDNNETREKNESGLDVDSINRKEEICITIQKKIVELSGLASGDITYTTIFVELGFDSLFLAQVALVLEKIFKVKVKFRQLNIDYPNIEKLAEYIYSQLPMHDSKSDQLAKNTREMTPKKFMNLAPIQPNGAKNPFFLVHGGMVNNSLPGYLGNDQPYYGFFHQGADGEQVKYTTVEDIAAHYLNELLSIKQEGPYLLGGFSFGGIVAYEMSQQLIARGRKVGLLVLIDTFYPQATGITKKKLSLFIILRKLFYGLPNKIYDITIKKPVCHYCLYRKKPLPVKFRYYYILNNYIKMSKMYFPKPLNCSGVFFCASQNEFLYSDQLWGKLIEGDMPVHEIPGNHATIISNPDNFKILAKKIKYYLDMAQD